MPCFDVEICINCSFSTFRYDLFTDGCVPLPLRCLIKIQWHSHVNATESIG